MPNPVSTLHSVGSQLLSKLTNLFVQVEENRFHEFEVKFGHISTGGQFTNGISRTHFDLLFNWLNGAGCWRNVAHNEYVDYEFKNNLRGSGGLFQDDIHYITKQLHSHLDVRCASSKSPSVACRFSLKSEIPCQLGIGRDIGTYNSVRVKQRSSFFYKCWSFDLTRVWTGPNPWQALSNQVPPNLLEIDIPLVRDRAPDQFEMEIEYLPSWWKENTFDQDPSTFHSYLATALFSKIGDVLSQAQLVDPSTLVQTVHKEIQIRFE